MAFAPLQGWNQLPGAEEVATAQRPELLSLRKSSLASTKPRQATCHRVPAECQMSIVLFF